MGDFNDLLHQSEKRSRAPHPPWCITGFGDAVADCGLQDMPFSGYQYTWVRSRGRSNMAEEKLDRILVTEDWRTMFAETTSCSLPCVYSDHIPLLLTPIVAVNGVRRKRFLFDNMWLREDRCREIVAHSWERTRGQDVLHRIEICGRDIWRWGKSYNRDFKRRIDQCKLRLERLQSRYDQGSVAAYEQAERDYIAVLEQQHYFWKQRAKEHWYKGEIAIVGISIIQ
ncbi:PREDICTED: uncharacterized protein LOC109149232 [Ipomoea nil]|uniref:uncharacterized protein LOC109149232 n=1 Tax=Ipomoea nil TaxID=35883 RepID=UPI0009008D03|nr:PREDICTED: uncharacterized protein LOC109149232 [Ipomoea nil]